jgi:hypothetical protein
MLSCIPVQGMHLPCCDIEEIDDSGFAAYRGWRAPNQRVCHQDHMFRDRRDNLEAVLWLSMTICLNGLCLELEESIIGYVLIQRSEPG